MHTNAKETNCAECGRKLAVGEAFIANGHPLCLDCKKTVYDPEWLEEDFPQLKDAE